jgi:cysteine desulfuration protein SufE
MEELVKEGLPPRLAEIVEDFQFAEGREKLDLLLEYSENLSPLPERFKRQHEDMEAVPECLTPVFVQAEVNEGRIHFFFDVPPESPTVRGYAALLEEGLQDVTPEQVLQIPADFYLKLGLQHVLSPQRMNGITALLAHLKQLALKYVS